MLIVGQKCYLVSLTLTTYRASLGEGEGFALLVTSGLLQPSHQSPMGRKREGW